VLASRRCDGHRFLNGLAGAFLGSGRVLRDRTAG